jgi:hypothetical protein
MTSRGTVAAGWKASPTSATVEAIRLSRPHEKGLKLPIGDQIPWTNRGPVTTTRRRPGGSCQAPTPPHS